MAGSASLSVPVGNVSPSSSTPTLIGHPSPDPTGNATASSTTPTLVGPSPSDPIDNVSPSSSIPALSSRSTTDPTDNTSPSSSIPALSTRSPTDATDTTDNSSPSSRKPTLSNRSPTDTTDTTDTTDNTSPASSVPAISKPSPTDQTDNATPSSSIPNPSSDPVDSVASAPTPVPSNPTEISLPPSIQSSAIEPYSTSNCTHCIKTPTMVCDSCQKCPSLHERDRTGISYCSVICEYAHWDLHSPGCKIREQRQELFRTMNIAQYTYQVFRSYHYDRIIASATYKDGWVWIQEDILNKSGPFYWPAKESTRYIAARQLDIFLYLSWKLGDSMLPVMELLFKDKVKEIQKVDNQNHPDRHIDLLNDKGEKIDSKKSALFQITANDGHRYCFDLNFKCNGWNEYHTSCEESTACCDASRAQLTFIPRDFGINMSRVQLQQISIIPPQNLSLLDEVQKLVETCPISELGSLSNELYQENAARFIEDLQSTFGLLDKDNLERRSAEATDVEGEQVQVQVHRPEIEQAQEIEHAQEQVQAPEIEGGSRLRRFGRELKALFCKGI